MVQRGENESLRKYIQRFCQVRNTIPSIADHNVIYAFRSGVCHNIMLEKLESKAPRTTTELFELTDRVAHKEEARVWNPRNPVPTSTNAAPPASREERRERRRKRKSSHGEEEGHVLATDDVEKPSRKGKPVGNHERTPDPRPQGQAGDKWCMVHQTSRHNLSECHSVKNLAERIQKYEQERREREKETRHKGKAPAEPTNN